MSIAQSNIPPMYAQEFSHKRRCLGALYSIQTLSVCTLALGALAAPAAIGIVLSGKGHWLRQLSDALKNISWSPHSNLIAQIVVPTLTVGAGVILFRVTRQIDPILKHPVRVTKENLQAIRFDDETFPNSAYLTGQKGQKAYVYSVKSLGEHYQTSTTLVLATPPYLVGTVAYNVIRIAPSFLYYGYRACRGKSRAIDCIKEPIKSVWRIVKAPFYATAFLFATIYSLVKPMEGRILTSLVERDWNEGVPLARGYWCTVGKRNPDWNLESGGFYLAGCHQPIGVYHGTGNAFNSLRKEVGVAGGHRFEFRRARSR